MASSDPLSPLFVMMRLKLARSIIFVFFILAAVAVVPGESPRKTPWTTSKVRGTPDPPPPLTIEQVYQDIALQEPTEMIRVPGTNRWIVTEVRGRLHSFSKGSNREPREAINLRDVQPRATQTYGIVFHPEFPKKPWCYIAYSSEPKSLTGTRLSRFRVQDTSWPIIDPESETVLAKWNSEGHSGGSLHFGSDGYLYVSVGDGQNPNPPDRLDTGQDLSDFEASILRIDVDHPSGDLPYSIPKDNPFVGQQGIRGEIWAYGFRNPWKMAFDPVSDTLWTGDVGWEMMEMVYRVDRGANYGWSVMEGSQVVKENGRRTSTPITPPIVEHTHLEARSITGGYFWYSDRLPELKGAYLYGDWMTGKIWALKHDGQQVTWHQEIADTDLRVICFALDDDGEVLVVGYDGTVHRLVPNTAQAASADFPRKLSEAGLFESTEGEVPAEGVVEYEINAHHWADHTSSRQWLAVPDSGQLDIYDQSDWKTGQVEGHFVFPHDTVLAKTIYYHDDPHDFGSVRRLETQLLHRNGDDWNAYNYVWNEEQTDAILQDNVGFDREILLVDPRRPSTTQKQTWHHASRDECLLCHIWSASTVHGFKLDQLNRVPAGSVSNQLDRLSDLGLFAAKVSKLGPAISPEDTSASLHARARSYLHMNCAHCHRRGGGGTAPFELVGDLALEQLNVVDVPPSQGDFGLKAASVVASGNPYHSVLMYRLVKNGRGHMPQFGPSLIDDSGVILIRDWIESLGPASQAEACEAKISQILAQTCPLDQQAIASIDAVLDSTNDALALSIACCEADVDDALRMAIADVASRRSDSSVRDLFERFLPEERRVKRLGGTIDAQALLAIDGDAEAGRELFFNAADVNCRQCHQIAGQGVAVGPDLSGIGATQKPAEILESILRPSAKIDAKYRGKLLLTVDGVTVAGMVVREDAESITIVEASGKPTTILQDEIELIKPMDASVMPERLLSEFTAEQAANLLAFLFAQKQAPPPPSDQDTATH